jgi:hypothetical protein
MNVSTPGPTRLFSQYATQPDGALCVNGQKIPLVGPHYTIPGLEHRQTFLPNSPYYEPQTEFRQKLGKTWFGKEKVGGDEKSKGKIICWAGIVVAVIIGCVAPHVCCP